MALMAGAVAGSAALGAGSSLVGSGKASSGAKQAAATNLAMYNATANRLQPWVSMGQGAIPNMLAAAPDTMTEAEMQNMPGYNFMLNQGIKATQAGAAARGLGVSGASLKGAATYAQGLADQTYQQLFQQKQTQFQNQLNIAGMGENAAAQPGTAGTSAAATAGGQLGQAGLAQAAGATGVGSAATGAAQNYLNYNLMQQYQQRFPPGGTGQTQWTPQPIMATQAPAQFGPLTANG